MPLTKSHPIIADSHHGGILSSGNLPMMIMITSKKNNNKMTKKQQQQQTNRQANISKYTQIIRRSSFSTFDMGLRGATRRHTSRVLVHSMFAIFDSICGCFPFLCLEPITGFANFENLKLDFFVVLVMNRRFSFKNSYRLPKVCF